MDGEESLFAANLGVFMSDSNQGVKVCVRCKADCTGRPRVKDVKGRYTCKDCFDQLAAARGELVSAKTGGAPSVGASVASDPTESTDNPLFSSGSDAYSIADAAPIPQISCGKCGQGRPPSMIVCPGCGHNPFDEKPQAEPKAKKKKPKGPMQGLSCASCGYDMKGLKSLKCPECGHQNRISTKRDFYEDVSRDVVRAAYMKPAVIGLVCTGIIIASSLSMGGLPMLAVMSILLFLGYAVFWVVTQICSYLWIGLDADLKLFTVQLFAAHASANALWIGLAAVTGGLNLLGGLTGGVVMVLLLMGMVEMEKFDAVVVVLINRILMFALQVVLFMIFGF
jgi:hypothetical protein